MHLRRVALLAALLISIPAFPQTNSETTSVKVSPATKDTGSTAIIKKSLSAMGVANVDLSTVDSIAKGTLKIDGVEMPIVIKTKGTNRVRVEVQQPKGQSIFILNNGEGQIQQANGKIRKVLMKQHAGSARVAHPRVVSAGGKRQDSGRSAASDI